MSTFEDEGNAWVFHLSEITQHLGTTYQLYIMKKKNNNIQCVSLDTHIIFLVSTIARHIWERKSYLNEYFITYIELYYSYFIEIYFIYNYLHNCDKISDEILSLRNKIYESWYFLIFCTLILSLFFNVGYDEKFFNRTIFISYHIFSDSVSLIPQIPLIYKEGDIGALSRVYLIFIAISRILRIIFWFIPEEALDYFLYLIIADIIHTVVLIILIITFVVTKKRFLLPLTDLEPKQKET